MVRQLFKLNYMNQQVLKYDYVNIQDLSGMREGSRVEWTTVRYCGSKPDWHATKFYTTLSNSANHSPSVQLDLESGTICRWTSDNQTCHTAISDSRWRHCNLVSGPRRSMHLHLTVLVKFSSLHTEKAQTSHTQKSTMNCYRHTIQKKVTTCTHLSDFSQQASFTGL